jgi:hypothetical protein
MFGKILEPLRLVGVICTCSSAHLGRDLAGTIVSYECAREWMSD